METALEFAKKNQYDLESYDEGGYLGINENAFARLLDDYADQRISELNKIFVDRQKELLFTFIKEIKSEFECQNWD